MASLLEAFIISVAEGTPIRLNLIPYKKMNHNLMYNVAIVSIEISSPLIFYIYQTYLLHIYKINFIFENGFRFTESFYVPCTEFSYCYYHGTFVPTKKPIFLHYYELNSRVHSNFTSFPTKILFPFQYPVRDTTLQLVIMSS